VKMLSMLTPQRSRERFHETADKYIGPVDHYATYPYRYNPIYTSPASPDRGTHHLSLKHVLYY